MSVPIVSSGRVGLENVLLALMRSQWALRDSSRSVHVGSTALVNTVPVKTDTLYGIFILDLNLRYFETNRVNK